MALFRHFLKLSCSLLPLSSGSQPGLRVSSLLPLLSLAGCSGDLCPAGLACHHLSEFSTPRMGIASPFPSTIFFPLQLPAHHFIYPITVISSFEGMGFKCTKALTLQKAESSQTSPVLSTDLCCSQARAVWRGLTVWRNSFSPETEEDKVSCLFSASHLSLPHQLSQAGFRLMTQGTVFNPCLPHASRGESCQPGNL